MHPHSVASICCTHTQSTEVDEYKHLASFGSGPATFKVQCSLCLGSIGMDHVISELCYIRAIFQKSYRKMTIL